jgi:threonyl-tRNA synthetase
MTHLFVTPEQLEEEFIGVVELIQFVFGALGFSDFRARLGINDPNSDKYAGSPEMWNEAVRLIRKAADKVGMNYTVEVGEAAFYGPKLDFIVRDVLKREWQLGTVQVDFLLPERFGLEYTGEDGQKHRPVMIHRAPFGSLERFTGILIEHFNGAFPLWLAPVQVIMIPIADRHIEYANQVAKDLRAAGLRVEVDKSGDRMNKQIRNAQLQKIPYMLVVGDNEEAEGKVAVRTREGEDRGPQDTADFIAQAKDLIDSKSMEI